MATMGKMLGKTQAENEQDKAIAAQEMTEADARASQTAALDMTAESEGRRLAAKDDFADIDNILFGPDSQDPFTGKQRSPLTNGASPERAINESPLSALDRLKLSVADEKGKDAFLKERFGEVKKNKFGELVVNDDGAWKMVDPEGFGQRDPWEVTKRFFNDETTFKEFAAEMQASAAEGIGDLADAAPEIGMAAAAIGAGIATGGASLALQAGALTGTGLAASLASTSMGKLAGTYTGDLEDQLGEASMEAGLNLLGVLITPAGSRAVRGMKNAKKLLGGALVKSGDDLAKAMRNNKAGSFFLDVLDKVGESAKSMSKGSKELVAQIVGAPGKAGIENIELLLNKTPAVKAALKGAIRRGGNDKGALDSLSSENRKWALEFVEGIDSGISTMYKQNMDEVAKAMPKGEIAQTGRAVDDFMQELVKKGLVKFNAQKGKGAYEMVPEEDLLNLVATGDDLIAPLQDEAGARIIFRDMIKSLSNIAKKSEPGDFKKLIDSDIRARQVMNTVQKKMFQPDNPGAARLSKGMTALRNLYDGKFDGRMAEGLSKFENIAASKGSTKGIGALLRGKVDPTQTKVTSPLLKYKETKRQFHEVERELLPLKRIRAAVKDISKDDSGQLERLAKRLAGHRNDTILSDTADAAIEKVGKVAPQIMQARDQILINDTAAVFLPKVRGSFVQFAPLYGAIGAAESVGEGGGLPMKSVLGTAGIVAATSPRLIMHGILKSQGAKQALAGSLRAARQVMMNAGDEGIKVLRNNPRALGALQQGIMRAPVSAAQQEEQSNAQIEQMLMGQ